ncbi:M14-type cytosolic carboxypeptidase [Lacimicrobium sp. SS2-24]|uniref:M14 family metallopeptidase n=1 Tax=Lacimicrobium sp. SS2-24 TaxID=2005569 RepID=UPI000B4B4D1B|nr:M14-type cytosolic carboxypeptidase [Lacimicrobium sp. SS2-24]
MIHIHSDFEGGAIRVIKADSAEDIQLEIDKDNQACARQWFYFAVESDSPALQTVRLLNAADVSFTGAWEGYQAFASYDQENWFRVNTTFADGELRLTQDVAHRTIYYAYFVPYLAARHEQLITSLQSSLPISKEVLGKTVQGRDIELLRFGDGHPNNKKLWIIARQHPGETMAQWVMEGLIQELAERYAGEEDSVSGVSFYLVANMNPDGAALGNHRTNASGADLNRQWASSEHSQCPEVMWVRQAMTKIGVDGFVDLHGDEAIPHNFIMVEDGHPQGEQVKQVLARLDSNFQTQYDYASQKRGCGASTCGSKCGQQTATQFVSKQFGVPSLLLEAAFKPILKAGQLARWDHEECIQLGKHLASALNVL